MIKLKQGIGYGEAGGSPHLISEDGRFEIYKYEKTYNLRRYLVSRGYKVIDNAAENKKNVQMFERLKNAKQWAEGRVEIMPASSFVSRWTKVIEEL